MIYYIIFFVLFLFSLLDLFIKDKMLKVPFLALIIIFMICFSGLRWKTGGDWDVYAWFYGAFNPDKSFFKIAFEPGYTLLVYLLRKVSDSYTIMLFALAILTIGFRTPFLYKYTPSIFVLVLLTWGNNMFEVFGTRQAVAISIGLYNISNIIKKKPFWFIFWTIIALQFHASSIIFFLAYPIYHANWSTKSKIFWMCFCVLIGFSGLLSFLLEFVGNIAIPGLGRLSEKAKSYSEIDTNSKQALSGTNKMVALASGIAKRIVIFPLLFFFEKKIGKQHPMYLKMMNLFVFANCLYFICSDFLILQRMAGYFYPLEALLLCMIFDYDKARKYLWYLLFSLYALVKLTFIVQGTKDYILPYYWIYTDETPRSFKF